jgi:hypothetical protein
VGDVAACEEHFNEAERAYESALCELKSHPCPVIEWKILAAWASLAGKLRKRSRAEELRERSRKVKRDLAESISDVRLRQRFLSQ